jgi:prevent-host-death family protein
VPDTVARMTEFGMHAAKTNLSKLVERALDGEEIVITRRGKPAVRLEPVREKVPFRELLGIWKGQVWEAPDHDWFHDADIEKMFDLDDPDDPLLRP